MGQIAAITSQSLPTWTREGRTTQKQQVLPLDVQNWAQVIPRQEHRYCGSLWAQLHEVGDPGTDYKHL